MNVVVDHVTKTIHGAVVLQDISLNAAQVMTQRGIA